MLVTQNKCIYLTVCTQVGQLFCLFFCNIITRQRHHSETRVWMSMISARMQKVYIIYHFLDTRWRWLSGDVRIAARLAVHTRANMPPFPWLSSLHPPPLLTHSQSNAHGLARPTRVSTAHRAANCTENVHHILAHILWHDNVVRRMCSYVYACILCVMC